MRGFLRCPAERAGGWQVAVPRGGACRSQLSRSPPLQEGAFPNLFRASFSLCTCEREGREGRDGSRALQRTCKHLLPALSIPRFCSRIMGSVQELVGETLSPALCKRSAGVYGFQKNSPPSLKREQSVPAPTIHRGCRFWRWSENTGHGAFQSTL